MMQAMVTFVAPLPLAKLAAAETAIEALQNPASDAVTAALALGPNETEGTHFASLHAFASPDGQRAYILFEFSADGGEDAATARIVTAIGAMLRPVFMLSSEWRDGDLGAFLDAHKVTIDNGLFGNPGLPFAGTPGFSVGRIRFEAELARECTPVVEHQDRDLSALERIARVRDHIRAKPGFAAALEPAEATAQFVPLSLVDLVVYGLRQFVTTYLWPLIAAVLIVALLGGLVVAWPPGGPLGWVLAFSFGAALTGLFAAGFAVAAVIVVGVAIYVALRRAEASDSVDPHSPTKNLNAQMFARENVGLQNHMISITQRKPGWLRWFTARLGFFVVGLAATRYFKPGLLSDIGTIHFARWVTVPGTRDVVFLSNYGGSWESYLEDFITKAHAGLTAVWSNTIGFPRTENLFQKGATDGDRFKRFARHSMVPTRFWYSAYPDLTTATIRTNAAIRAGLSGVMTEDEAVNWLALFGSASRPASKLVSSDIQSLLFGGLKFLPFGTCLICTLPEDRTKANAWLRAIRPKIAFNDGRRITENAVITLSLTWTGLKKLGLPEYAGPTFPFAFVEGMTTAYRQRILGDTGPNAPESWAWGRDPMDAAILVYGLSPGAVDALRHEIETELAAAGAPSPRIIPLKTVADGKVEPFGFADGTSQPIIRGTYKSLRNGDPIHIVEPGEMILGYPDNRGYIPPSPTLEPNSDPGNKLPLLGAANDFSRTVVDATRDVGFNGSFLVIRQLEQDVAGFGDYCRTEAAALSSRLPPPYVVDDEFIGAKLVGRWKDGSSLVRHPYESATRHRQKLVAKAEAQADLTTKLQAKGELAAGVVLPSESIDAVTSRPKSNPSEGGTPIDTAPKQVDLSAIVKVAGAATGGPAAAAYPHHREVNPDNDFLYGSEDPEGLRCPYGAHIRRANPRDSLDPGNADQIAISNRHRITRVGRQYVPAEGENPGLFFMCFCADIERQFEFLQQTWLTSPSFHGLSCEKDPLLGDGQHGSCGYTMPTSDGPVGLSELPRFVTTKGGGYFFIPGRRLIDYLTDPF